MGVKSILASAFILISVLSNAQNHYTLAGGVNYLSNQEGREWRYRIGAEVGFNSWASIRADFRKGPFGYGWSKSSTFDGNTYEVWVNGWGIDIGPRFYLRHRRWQGPFGFYISPNLILRRVNESFSGYLIDKKAPPYQLAAHYPYANLNEKGFAWGAGIALGWKIVWECLFYEPGISVDFAKASYASSDTHAIISNYYNTSDIMNINVYLNVGLYYKKGMFSEE